MLDIVIVNWNSDHYLHDCLESIAMASLEGFKLGRVVVVDNNSSDDSLEGVDSLPIPLEIIYNSENKGFGAACNQGAAIGESKYILFLNPDTVLQRNSLRVPLLFMEDESNQNVGTCGIQLLDNNKVVARHCARFLTPFQITIQVFGMNKIQALKRFGTHMSEWDHLSDRFVNHVIGAFFFTRRAVFVSIDGFDERFFVYLEDIDYSFRLNQKGWETKYLTAAQAFHEGGGASKQIKATRLFYSLRSRLLYFKKHFSSHKFIFVFFLTIVVEPFIRVFYAIVRINFSEAKAVLLGYGMLFKNLINIMERNRKGS